MTTIDVTFDGKNKTDVIVATPQPTVPAGAKPADIGYVEISTRTIRGSIWFTGTGAPTNPGQQTGDMYLDMNTGDVYQWDGDSWVFEGKFAPSTDTPAEVLAKLVTVDGAGSGLDADLLDGHDSPYFATQTDMTALTSTVGTNTSNIATNTSAIATETTNRTNADTTLQNNINLKADIASPTFTGDARAVTPATSDNDTSIATTAYVKANLAALPPSGIPEAPNDGITYGRKSLAWAAVVGGAIVSDTPPTPPLSNGQLYFESDTGALYLWYDDGTSTQWVMVAGPPSIQQITVGTTAPSSPSINDLWVDTN